jgi:hypothetical protein
MTLLSLGLAALILHWVIRPISANSPQIFVTTTLMDFDAQIVAGWSGGGGDNCTIHNDSNNPFAGREFGGADRSTLKGTQIFGSGYPYGNVDNSTIAGRPFPYGLWPIYWGNNITGSDEYGAALDALRPGGQLATIPLQTQTQYYNITDDETYYLIGDRDSVLFMMISLVTSCQVTPAWPTSFNPGSPNSTVKIENVIQYYRASSFALVYPQYSNTAALRNNNTESTESTPLPDVVVYSTFRRCLDDVIMNALGIMDQPPHYHDLGDILGWVFGVFGIPILYFLWCLYRCSYNCAVGSVRTSGANAIARLRREQAALDARKASLAYENYP